MKRLIHATTDFDAWYDSLTTKTQYKVDDLADELGLPDYDECSPDELSMLHDNFISKVNGSFDPTEADLYVVKIWYEIDPGHDVAAPEAAEEIIKVVATSPDAALEIAKEQWTGPIDRIEIVDVNPDEDVEELPFNAKTSVKASKGYANSPAREASDLIRYLSSEGVDEHTFIEFFIDNIPSDKMIELMKQLADECDIDLSDFYE